MALPQTPKFVYGATTLTLTHPVRPWTAGTQGMGAGIEWSAAGIPSVWETRREHTRDIPLRFTEAEWPGVRAMLLHGMGGGAITYYPDQALATSHACYLLAPEIGDAVRPARGEYVGMLELTITLRRTDGAAMDGVYY
jgi:hypothetical protein